MNQNKTPEYLDNESALDAYIRNLAAAQAASERINEYLLDNGETSPENINWGHVGSMNHLANQLNELKDMIDGTGEYAD